MGLEKAREFRTGYAETKGAATLQMEHREMCAQAVIDELVALRELLSPTLKKQAPPPPPPPPAIRPTMQLKGKN